MKNNKDTNIQEKKVLVKKRKKRRSILSFFIKLFVFLIIVSAGVVSYMIYSIKKETPTELIESYSPISPSVIYDINGNQLDTIIVENRSPISINDIPRHVQDAFLAIEDRKFRTEHQAKYIQIDFDRTLNGMIGLTGSAFRGVGSYGLIKSGVSLLLIPEPTPTTKIAGIFVAGYGIGEAIFSFLDGAESG